MQYCRRSRGGTLAHSRNSAIPTRAKPHPPLTAQTPAPLSPTPTAVSTTATRCATAAKHKTPPYRCRQVRQPHTGHAELLRGGDAAPSSEHTRLLHRSATSAFNAGSQEQRHPRHGTSTTTQWRNRRPPICASVVVVASRQGGTRGGLTHKSGLWSIDKSMASIALLPGFFRPNTARLHTPQDNATSTPNTHASYY